MPDFDMSDIVESILMENQKPRVQRPDIPLSKKQIEIHYDDLYLGYLKKFGEITRKLKATQHNSANAVYSEFRSLKRAELSVLNAIRLHEAYFENLSKSKCSQYVSDMLKENFSSITKWENDFIACGLSAKGWVILSYDRSNKQLINLISDDHEQYVLHMEPILVMDLYEHSYMIDFGSNKIKYIEFFLDNINWDCVASRLSNVDGD